jgi:hypothetical protein
MVTFCGLLLFGGRNLEQSTEGRIVQNMTIKFKYQKVNLLLIAGPVMPQMGIIGGYEFVNVTQAMRDGAISAAIEKESLTVTREYAAASGIALDENTTTGAEEEHYKKIAQAALRKATGK